MFNVLYLKVIPKYACVVFLSMLCLSLFSQNRYDYIVVDHITILGNDITQRQVILRELDFEAEDTIYLETLPQRINVNRKRLTSTGLFNYADINIKDWDITSGRITIEVNLKENWYIFPSIIFELADRSFNVWWKEMNFDFNRVNYGLRLDHLNTTGHGDKLKLKLQRGYTHKYELDYSYPYLLGKWGGGVNVLYSNNREIGFRTVDNKVIFKKWEDERILLERMRLGFTLSRRDNAYLSQRLKFQWHKNEVNEVVPLDLNTNYFLDGKKQISFPVIEYEVIYDKRTFPTYAEGGFLLFFNLRKSGINDKSDYNNLEVSGGMEAFSEVAPRLYLGVRLKAKTNLNRNQLGYANNSALGYGEDAVRGYELYVLDGSDFMLAKSAIRYKIYDSFIPLGKLMPLKRMRSMPVSWNVRIAMEAGYANERHYTLTNDLNNKVILGGGPAMDLLLYNNYLFSAEYNFNQIGQSGLYLQSSFNF